MRSLGLSPTIIELTQYMKKKNGKMSFSDFLDVMYYQKLAEKIPAEIIEAFRAADLDGKGMVQAKVLKNMLTNWGEKLSSREVDNIFREANVSNNGYVNYADFVKICAAPIPDYY